MTLAIESSYAAEWLYDTLTGDATLMALIEGVYEQPAPESSAHPMVVFNLQSDVDTVTGDSLNRIFSNQLWLVRATVEDTSYATAKTIADRMDTVLQNANGTADGATIYTCTREETFRLVDVENGKQYRHLGGMYRLIVQKG